MRLRQHVALVQANRFRRLRSAMKLHLRSERHTLFGQRQLIVDDGFQRIATNRFRSEDCRRSWLNGMRRLCATAQ